MDKRIKIGCGNGKKKDYFLWEEYLSFEDAKDEGKKMKEELHKEGKNVRTFIVETSGRFGLYFSKKLRI